MNTLTKAEQFARGQLLLALDHSPNGIVLIHGSDTKHWRETYFISPTEAVKAAVSLSEHARNNVTIERKPGVVTVKRGGGR